MASQLESSVVRIYANSGKVIGAGFLVSPQQVLTCAHVVAFALGIRADSTEMPSAEVSLDFPRVAPGRKLKAKVIFWLPVNPQESVEDIAALELTSPLPEAVRPSRLVTAEDLWGHGFRVLGFPEGKSNGAWASGTFRGGIANGWVQLEDIKQSGYRLEEGFSGAPVWDEELQGVAGMAVAAEKQRVEAKAAFIIPASILVSAWDVLRERAIPPCPYRGLFAFREEDARFFFGREVFAERLVAAVARQSLVAVVGASGSGKSSVVFAGLVPRLRQQGNWLIESFRPKANPIDELAAVLVRLREPNESKVRQDIDAGDLAKQLREGSLTVGTLASRILEENSSASGLLLIVDQFEELYTLCRESREQQQFLDLLLAATNQTRNLTLVLTLRADFFGYALSYRPFADALQNADVKLGPMNPEELRQIVEEPAKLLGVRIEAGLTERILQAVQASPGNLPLLEFALTQLWEKQERGQLTHEAYEDIGGVEKALANHAETIYERMDDADKERARQIFIQLVRPGEGTEDTRRLATKAELSEDNWELVKELADARLVVTNRNGEGRETVEVVHEALISHWGKLRQWMEVDREFRVWQERLRVALSQWDEAQQNDGALLHGVALGEAETRLKERESDLGSVERKFIRKSLGLRDREKQKREREQRQTVIGLTGLSVVSLILAGIALLGWRQAVVNEKNAQLQALSRRAELLISENQFEALLENFRVGKKLQQELKSPFSSFLPIKTDTKIQVIAALHEIVTMAKTEVMEVNHLEQRGDRGKGVYGVNSISFSPDSQLLAAARDDGTIQLWRRDGSLIKTVKEEDGTSTNSVSFSPDGQLFASASQDGTIQLWRRDGTLFKSFKSHQGEVTEISFHPNGPIIATAGKDDSLPIRDPQESTSISSREMESGEFSAGSIGEGYSIKLWNLDGTVYAKPIQGHKDRITSVSFHQDGQTLASASGDKTVRLWKLDGTEVRNLTEHTDAVNSVRFSYDGQILASASSDNMVKLWNLDGELIQTLKGHSWEVKDMSFSPDGKILASASWDNQIKFWNLDVSDKPVIETQTKVSTATLSPNSETIAIANTETFNIEIWNLEGILINTLTGNKERISSLSFSPNGQLIVSGDWDKTIRLWDVEGEGVLFQVLKGHKAPISSVSFSPDGQLFASGSLDKTITLWRVSNDSKLFQFFLQYSSDIDEVNRIAFSPDSQSIISASKDNIIRFWKLDGTEPKLLPEDFQVTDLSFSPNKKLLAFSSSDSTVRLWNGKILRTLYGHQDRVNSVSWRSDSLVIVTGGEDGAVKLWSIETGEFKTLEGIEHSAAVLSASFIPHSSQLVSIDRDGKIIMWNLDLDELLENSCELVDNYLKTNPNVDKRDRDLCDSINKVT